MRVRLGGSLYYNIGDVYYRPIYYGGIVYYEESEPPYVIALPPEHQVIVVHGTTYYENDNVYYLEAEQEGQTVYRIVDRPDGTASEDESMERAALPDPFALLKKMSEHLAQAPVIGLVADSTIDEIVEGNQKIQVSSRNTISVRRPNAARATVTGDGLDKEYWYDGAALTILDRGPNLFCVIDVPQTLGAMFEFLADRFGMTLPLADLFYDDPCSAMIADTRSGQYVGMSRVGDSTCHHLAFAGDIVDWEIWIAAGDSPLPRRLAITYKQRPLQPRCVVRILEWRLDPTFAENHFAFERPEGAERIAAADVQREAQADATSKAQGSK